MMNPYLLLAIGLLLILLEFYLPGAIMGISGICLIIFSIVLMAMQSGSALEVALFIGLSLAGIAAVIKFALWQIRGTSKKKTIFLETDQEGYIASSFDPKAVGKSGMAITDLKPGGYALIEGTKYPVISASGYIEKGTEVTVISGQGDSLLVKLTTKKEET